VLVEHAEYHDEKSLADGLDGGIFKYCTFKDFSLDGKEVDAVFLSCEMSGLDWYWGLFNCCLFVDTKFANCVFRGTNFADSRFLNCEFINCRFEDDNMHAPCRFEGVQWFGGTAVHCKGLPDYAFPLA